MGIENFRRQTILGERLARERFERAYPIVKAGFQHGDFKYLRPRQREVLIDLYSLNNLPKENSSATDPTFVRYEQCGVSLGMTRQAVEQSHNSAIRRLKRVKNGMSPVKGYDKSKPAYRLEMKPQDRRYILAHSDLPATALSRVLGHSEEIIGRWKDELHIPRKSRGHPKGPRTPVGSSY